jgi:hypothetical protein
MQVTGLRPPPLCTFVVNFSAPHSTRQKGSIVPTVQPHVAQLTRADPSKGEGEGRKRLPSVKTSANSFPSPMVIVSFPTSFNFALAAAIDLSGEVPNTSAHRNSSLEQEGARGAGT